MGVVLVDETGAALNQTFKVFPSHYQAQALFHACSTQWRRNPMTGALEGMDYQGVESAARLMGTTVTPELFEQLQWIERGALGARIEDPELNALTITNIEFLEDEQDDSHWHPDHG